MQVGSVFLFPAFGLQALRGGGPRRLRVATLIALAVIAAFAVAASAPWSGNRVSTAYGYADSVPRALLLFGFTLGLPVVGASGAVRLAGGRIRAILWPYAIGVIAAGFGWVAGVVLATWMLPLVA